MDNEFFAWNLRRYPGPRPLTPAEAARLVDRAQVVMEASWRESGQLPELPMPSRPRKAGAM